MIVGAGDIGQLLAAKLLQQPGYGINVLGFIDAAPRAPRAEVAGVPILGTVEDLPALITSLDVERALIAFSGDSHRADARRDAAAERIRPAGRGRSPPLRARPAQYGESTCSRVCR